MADLQGQVGELRMTVEIKRKNTGEVEKFDLVGFVDPEKLKELQHGSNSLDGSAQRGD